MLCYSAITNASSPGLTATSMSATVKLTTDDATVTSRVDNTTDASTQSGRMTDHIATDSGRC